MNEPDVTRRDATSKEVRGMTASCEAFCWMTAQADSVEHAVTDEEQVTGMRGGMGWYVPLCGRRFQVACMDVGPLDRCSRCALLVQVRAELRDFEHRLTEYRRPGWLGRLLCRYQQPADVGSDTTSSGASAPRSAGLQPSVGADHAPKEASESPSASALRHRRGRHAP